MDTKVERNFPIVGIGASAGGVEALEGFFRPMPEGPGLAFVVVTHMPRDHNTMLPDIIGRFTRLPVRNIANGERARADHVYVCPADYVVTMLDGQFALEARASDHQNKPIDVFLSSLAEARAEDAVAVILSGGGSDGALGVKAIKERGGLTFAQGADGVGPRQSSMPETAIATGFIDLVLPVEKMAARIVELTQYTSVDDAAAADQQTREAEDKARQAIARLLHHQVGHDFSGYKEKTFMRRVGRRMQIVGQSSLSGYVALLERNREEISLLFRDLLIGVTNFFRDTSAFQALEELVVPKLFEGLGAADSIRIWVPGCATGEEVYSIAILMRERMDHLRATPRVLIFATDIDEPALAVARAGRYPQGLLTGVSPQRLDRFFTKDDSSYTIAREIRDLCVFSAHSVIRDPPFSRMDLVSCRNLLIYLGVEFQARVLPVFHFALKPGGFLFLGTSESVSHFDDLFQRVDKKQRLYQRRDQVSSTLRLPLVMPGLRRQGVSTGVDRRDGSPGATRRSVEARILDTYAPPHIVVNGEAEIVHFSPRTGKYLEAAAGMPSRQVFALARRGLRLPLRDALQEAMEKRRPAIREPVTVELDDRVQDVRLVVEPLDDHPTDPRYLIIFSDLGAPRIESPDAVLRTDDDSMEQLSRELRDTRERLQASVEEYETGLEELKAANEELVSVNEELQSTNEELESSREELQSVNEELSTVNFELNGKIDELDDANADLKHLFDSTEIATIFLDSKLVVRTFTQAARAVFKLISTDRGRPLTDIASTLADPDITRDTRVVLEGGEPIERRIATADGQAHYVMRILPYRGRHNTIEGVVVTFVDITGLVHGEAQLRTLIEELNHRVRNMLAVVGAIASRTAATATTPKEFADGFNARIRAMAATYGLIARVDWSDVALTDILAVVTQPYEPETGTRIHAQGPAVMLRPAAVVALGLVLHELATNAAKYGALSNQKGAVDFAWRTDDKGLTMSWRERDGPKVKAPTRKGFGMELVERELSGVLGGRADVTYDAKGLRVELFVPKNKALYTPSE